MTQADAMAPKAVMTSAPQRGWVAATVTGAGVSGALLTAARILTRGEVEEVALGGLVLFAGSAAAMAGMRGILPAARLLAAGTAVVWLLVLIHGGSGLVLGAVALLAAVVGGRFPAAAALLLGPPTVWLTASWAPELTHTRLLADTWGVWAVLTTPYPWRIWAVLTLPAATATATFAVVSAGRLAARMRRMADPPSARLR